MSRICGLVGALCLALCGIAGPVITLHPAQQFQTITGWEATAQAGQLACKPEDFTGTPKTTPAFPRYRDALYDLVVNDLGITRLRVEVNQVIENPTDYFTMYCDGKLREREFVHTYSIQAVNDNDNPQVINPDGFHFARLDHTVGTVVLPIKQRVEARGEKLFVNLCFVGFGQSPLGFYIYDAPEEYAEFMLAIYQHMQAKYGFVPDGIEVELEPDNTPFTGTKMGQAIKATAARLEAAGFTPRFIGPSCTNMSNTQRYFSEIKAVIGDDGVKKYLYELSYHRYGGVTPQALQWIGDTARANGIGASMLEHMGSSYQDLHNDLKVGNNTCWALYCLASPYFWLHGVDNGGNYYMIDERDLDQMTITPAPPTPFLRQYMHYIRPGAVRIDAATTDTAFDPVAFINKDGKPVVVVKAATGGSLLINGLAAGTYAITYTTNRQQGAGLPDVAVKDGNPVEVVMPEAGVLTVFGK